jgi:hypothetical protein
VRFLHLIQPLDTPPPWFAFSRRDGACAGEGTLLAIKDMLRESQALGDLDQHTVAVIGSTRARELCNEIGLRNAAFLSPPLGQPHRAGPALRRLVARAGTLDAAVLWGENLRPLGHRAAHASAAWFEVSMHSGELSQFLPTRRALGSVLPAFTATPHANTATRDRLRQRLGLSPIERAIALITDAACPASATDFLGAAAMLHVANAPATFIIPTACREIVRAQRRAREGTYVQRIIFTDLPASVAAHAADVCACAPALAFEAHASLAWIARDAVRCAVPVVVPEAWAGVWNTGTPYPLLVPAKDASPTELARALLRLHDAPPPATSPASHAHPLTPLSLLRTSLLHAV